MKKPRELLDAEAAYQRAWRKGHPELQRAIMSKARKKWRDANPGQAQAIQAENRYRVRREILTIIGAGKCARCDFSDWRALQLDHVNGDGHKEKGRLRLDVWKLRAWIKENPQAACAKYQVLCANCNWIKRHENNECRTIQ